MGQPFRMLVVDLFLTVLVKEDKERADRNNEGYGARVVKVLGFFWQESYHCGESVSRQRKEKD